MRQQVYHPSEVKIQGIIMKYTPDPAKRDCGWDIPFLSPPQLRGSGVQYPLFFYNWNFKIERSALLFF